MNAKHLILTLCLTLAAGAAPATFSPGAADPARSNRVAACDHQASAGAIPQVVITARRGQADAAAVQIPRVVVTGYRPDAAPVAARS